MKYERVETRVASHAVALVFERLHIRHSRRGRMVDPQDRFPEALPRLAGLIARGKLEVPVWRAYPLADAAQAHADIEARRNHGKIVLLPRPPMTLTNPKDRSAMSTRDLPEAIFARTRLGSGPGLLLAHGAGSSLANTYSPILEGLAARHTVVGIDYPGSGDTPRSTTR